MSPDWSAKAEPIPYSKLDNPQSLNLYGYVLNNPLRGVDPDGHIDCTGANGAGAGCQAILGWYAQHDVSLEILAAATQKAQQQNGDRPQTTDSVTVTAKPSGWKRIGGWFGSATHSMSYAATAFIITHSKLAMEGNKSSFEYCSNRATKTLSNRLIQVAKNRCKFVWMVKTRESSTQYALQHLAISWCRSRRFETRSLAFRDVWTGDRTDNRT
jgi:hypothetical protein